jgi:hypothetical protein
MANLTYSLTVLKSYEIITENLYETGFKTPCDTVTNPIIAMSPIDLVVPFAKILDHFSVACVVLYSLIIAEKGCKETRVKAVTVSSPSLAMSFRLFDNLVTHLRSCQFGSFQTVLDRSKSSCYDAERKLF